MKQHKSRTDLIDPLFLLRMGDVLALGAAKHGERSWEKDRREYDDHYGAAMRHLAQWRMGEAADDESGLSHLYHAATRIMILCSLEQQGIGIGRDIGADDHKADKTDAQPEESPTLNDLGINSPDAVLLEGAALPANLGEGDAVMLTSGTVGYVHKRARGGAFLRNELQTVGYYLKDVVTANSAHVDGVIYVELDDPHLLGYRRLS